MSISKRISFLLIICLVLFVAYLFVMNQNKPVQKNQIPNTTSQTINLSQITDKIKIGMTKNDIKNEFSDSYRTVKDLQTNVELWRYDISHSNGQAAFQGGVVERLNGDFVDVESILQDKLDLQIFIQFDKNDKVEMFRIYFKGTDNKVHEKITYPDKTEERIIEL
ncbi:hypothetical protein [Brevibacillus migulae]|uniref:hypothetical protein n=1 Tax=Brevibacillus migulae TaxID=1644114 RepID=UPI00106E85A4|nr:hypothetical protein [Brevibacillus migulae]